jgi:hypothetical protein
VLLSMMLKSNNYKSIFVYKYTIKIPEEKPTDWIEHQMHRKQYQKLTNEILSN